MDLVRILAMDPFSFIVWQVFMLFASMALAYGMRRKQGVKPPKSTLDDIQIPTQGEGEPFGVVFGTPARISHTHVLFYGNLLLKEKTYKEQTVAWEHWLTVHLGLSRSGIDAVQSLWYKDVPVWPTVRDETAAAADGTALANIAAFDVFGGWKRDGGISGIVDIEYGLSGQVENVYLSQGLNAVTGTVAAVSVDFGLVMVKIRSTTFDSYADGYFNGGTFTLKGQTVAIVIHSGEWIWVNAPTLLWFWYTGQQFVAVPPAGSRTPGPAYREIAALVFRHTYWGVTPVLGIISCILKRTLHLTGGDDVAQWYADKADIAGELNPAHILRECHLDPTWGEHMESTQLGTTWTAVANTLFTEGFGLSFFYVPEPGGLQDFVDLVLEHIDGYTWKDRTTGLLEIGLAREVDPGDLTEYDESDFEIVDWQTPEWHDIPGRVVLQYGNRNWPENTKTVAYDDIAVQAKQGGRINEKVVERPGIFSDVLAAKAVNRLGRQLCRLASIATLRAKRTMSDLHRGSVFKFSYDDPDLGITQMVVRVSKLSLGKLGDDAMTIDVVQDVWSDAYTIYGNPDTPVWNAPPIEPDEMPVIEGDLAAAGIITGLTGVGSVGAMAAAGAITGTAGVGSVGLMAAAGAIEGTCSAPA